MKSEKTSLRIVLVENEFIIARDIKQTLEKAGHSVVNMFTSGEDAAREIPLMDADLVIMDVFLKGNMDGVEAAEIISSFREKPFIFITGEEDTSIIPRLKNTKSYRIVHKPFSTLNLLTGIEVVYKSFSGFS